MRVVIIDDEQLACERMRTLLQPYDDVEVIADAEDAEGAVRLINRENPDAIFLDIQLTGQSGFDVLSRITCRPRVVFVTAYDEYAIRAFDVNALDYLLKPVRRERLDAAIQKLRDDTGGVGAATRAARQPTPAAFTYDDHVFLTLHAGSRFLKIRDVVLVTAEAPYTLVRARDGSETLVLKSLKEWEKRLPREHFARVHRAAIINLNDVERVERWFNYTYHVYVRGLGDPVPMSRRHAARLKGHF